MGQTEYEKSVVRRLLLPDKKQHVVYRNQRSRAIFPSKISLKLTALECTTVPIIGVTTGGLPLYQILDS